MHPIPSQTYEFGDFRMDVAERQLSRRDGTTVPLTPRVFETLRYLVEHSGKVLDKEQLMEAVWPDSIVEENNLTQNISTLRRVFGDSPDAHRYIVTVPGRGYRFVPEVRQRPNGATLEEAATPPVEPTAELAPPAADRLADLSTKKQKLQPIFLVALTLIVLGVVVFLFARSRTPTPLAAPARPASGTLAIPAKSIAVLPFANLSADQENAFFAEGVQDDILTALAKVADLKVISRTSVKSYTAGSERNLREIAEALGVATLLEGSVRRAGDRVRVTAQLIDTRKDTHLWAETYDRDLRDVFAIQSEIAQAIASQLQAKLSPREKTALAQAPTHDPVANSLYRQAIGLELHPPEHPNLLEAVRLLEEAVARDPQFLIAYCALSRMHLLLYFGGYDHSESRRELARVAIQKAVQIDPEAGEVHLAQAHYAYHGFRDYDRARAELDLARRTLPNEPTIYFTTAAIDRRQARWSDAIRNFERAAELDPRNHRNLVNAGWTYSRLRRFSEARGMYQRATAVSARGNYLARIEVVRIPLVREADNAPLRRELAAILAEDPAAGEGISEQLFWCAINDRDSAAVQRALAAIPPEGDEVGDNFVGPREWFVGFAAQTFNDPETARAAYTAARVLLGKTIRDQPDVAPAWGLIGRVDAALGRKAEAVREAQRACELLPLTKDAWFGPWSIRDLALVYASTGETDLALAELEKILGIQSPGKVSYGELKLDPSWDPLRGDPRFEKMVADLAPKNIPP